MSPHVTDDKRMAQLQVVALRQFLTDLARGGCETFTGPRAFNCLGEGRQPFAEFGADKACVPCLARQMLDSVASGSLDPMDWSKGINSSWTDAYLESAARIVGPERALGLQPPALTFPVDLDQFPSVIIPPQGAMVWVDGAGWVHFKTIETNS